MKWPLFFSRTNSAGLKSAINDHLKGHRGREVRRFVPGTSTMPAAGDLMYRTLAKVMQLMQVRSHYLFHTVYFKIYI